MVFLEILEAAMEIAWKMAMEIAWQALMEIVWKMLIHITMQMTLQPETAAFQGRPQHRCILLWITGVEGHAAS